MHFIDTHIHLYAGEFDADRDSLIDKAIHNGVERFYMPNIDSGSIEGMLKLERERPGVCIPMMGLHPCSVDDKWEKELDIVYQWLSRRKFAAIGEIGIDLYWDKTHAEAQKEAFRRQIGWALEFDAAIVIHSRESFAEIMAVLREFRSLPRGIFHCFSGNADQAREAISMGFMLGIGGVVTFKNSGLAEVVAEIPAEHLVLETDAPWLAPVPFRGKRNEPPHLLEIARKVASLKNLSMEELSSITSRNAGIIFGNT